MKLKILISVLLLVVIFIIGCKKFDLERIAMVATGEPTNVTFTTVDIKGTLIDLGENGEVQEYGFCLSYLNKPPTIFDKAMPPYDPTDITGDFSSYITDLTEGKIYQLRAYLIENSGEVTYGNVVEFETWSSGVSGEWLNYDNGINHTSVGLTEGGSFDIAIRFPTQVLSQYHGYNVAKIKFFPAEPQGPTKYSVTLWEGYDPPTLLHVEEVNLNFDQWNEIIPSYYYVINSSNEFWAGIWVQDHPVGTHPAGCDEGPAVTGAGDMISFDDGDTWEALSISNPALDYNWNLQVYVTNQKGKEIQLVKEIPAEIIEKKVSTPNISNKVSSHEMNK